MQISYFANGGFVAHKYTLPGVASRFSVWFGIDGFAYDAERIDKTGRRYSVPENSALWARIARLKIAGLENQRSIQAMRDKAVAKPA